MKNLKITLLGSAAVLALAMPAHAEAISLTIGNAIFSTLYTVGVSGAVANFVANAFIPALLLAGSVASSVFGRVGSVKPSDAKSTYSTEESSVREGIGYTTGAGVKFYGNTDGSTRWRLNGHTVGPIDAITEYYLGEKEVVIDDDTGYVTSPPWPKSDGTSWAKIEHKAGGGGETAWPALLAAFPGKWTSAHKVERVFQTLSTFYNPGLEKEKYLSLYQGGVPELRVVYRASLVYDATDETQDATDDATWRWTDNSVWCVIHVMRRDPRLFSPDMWDWTLNTLTAVKCDTHVATLTGTEKRSRLWGQWNYEDKRNDTVQSMLDSAGLVIRTTPAGKIYLEMIEDAPVAEISFTDDDIVSDDWSGGPEAVDRPNVCRVKYYCEPRDFEISEIDMSGIAWAQIDDEVTRYGEKFHDVELSYCPSASQAQRIARRLFALERAETYSATMKMVGMAAWGLQYAAIQTEYDDAPRLMQLGAPEMNDDDGTVSISGKYWPELSVWNPATDEAAAPEDTPALNYVADIDPPAPPTYAVQTTAPDGTRQLRLLYSVSGSPDVVEVNYRSYSGGSPSSWRSMTERSGVAYVALTSDILGQTIDARARVFEDEEGSDFSTTASLVVGVDNGLPPAPSLLSGGITVDGTIATLSVSVVSNDFRVAAIRLMYGTTVLQTVAISPGVAVGFSNTTSVGSGGGTVEWKIYGVVTNGSVGAALTLSAYIPDTGGGSD
ncbi:hypothetical protein GOZ83_19900 [Agrobacterium vitis]|uniref:phage tail protein n=1 Tax=Agrobacterium vitis TaxID=373 RepID=UPI0012E936D0|nr:phage tail protein [Agrobacterium vitis]MVA47321.1 hypothetical protein [Agrobacterium vitis]